MGTKRGCAVAYTDKGTGTGIHDLDTDTVNLVTGERARAPAAPERILSSPRASPPSSGPATCADYPHRVAVKHAHSQVNPEKDWGRNTLAAIEFAFHVLNGPTDRRAGRYAPENTLVIASSISNGAYAALAAAEQDTRGLIDGLALSEPDVSLADVRSTLDVSTLLNIYVPCASLADSNRAAPFNTVPQPLRRHAAPRWRRKASCAPRPWRSRLPRASASSASTGSFRTPISCCPHITLLSVIQGIAVDLREQLRALLRPGQPVRYSFAATTSSGVDAGDPIAAGALENSFALSNGIPPTAGINLVNDLSPAGAKEDRLSVSPSTGARDLNLDGALCLRSLATGVDAVSGRPLEGELAEQARRVQRGIEETRLTGNLRGKPAVFVDGRADGLLPPNYASRAYTPEQGGRTQLEAVLLRSHAWHHLDVLNGIAGFDSRYVPLNVYSTRALNLMWDHLKSGQPLPPSQWCAPGRGNQERAPGSAFACRCSPIERARARALASESTRKAGCGFRTSLIRPCSPSAPSAAR